MFFAKKSFKWSCNEFWAIYCDVSLKFGNLSYLFKKVGFTLKISKCILVHCVICLDKDWFIKKSNQNSKMNSLYQISSKMLHSTKVIILVGEKKKRWPGWDLNSRPPCYKSKVLTITPRILHNESVFFFSVIR